MNVYCLLLVIALYLYYDLYIKKTVINKVRAFCFFLLIHSMKYISILLNMLDTSGFAPVVFFIYAVLIIFDFL